jgi:hypothetical protein
MTRRTLEIAAFCAALAIAALAIHAWLAARDEQQRLQSTLAAQKQVLDAATSRENARQASLNDALAKIETLKRVTQTPQQILRDLPQYLPLPQPITLASSPTEPPPTVPHPQQEQGTALSPKPAPGPVPPPSPPGPQPASTLPEPPQPEAAVPCSPGGNCLAQIPLDDLKPLYDFTQTCHECQLRLTAAQQDHADDTTKIAALTRERDAALTAAKGGTFLRRLRRNALWFVVGAGIGAAVTHTASKP